MKTISRRVSCRLNEQRAVPGSQGPTRSIFAKKKPRAGEPREAPRHLGGGRDAPDPQVKRSPHLMRSSAENRRAPADAPVVDHTPRGRAVDWPLGQRRQTSLREAKGPAQGGLKRGLECAPAVQKARLHGVGCDGVTGGSIVIIVGPIASRKDSPRGAIDDAHRQGRKRARTLDSDGALNVPLRQKEGGLRPPSLPAPARTEARRHGVAACVAVLTTPFKAGPKHLQSPGCIRTIRRKKGGRSRPPRLHGHRSLRRGRHLADSLEQPIARRQLLPDPRLISGLLWLFEQLTFFLLEGSL
jgi:hypothetical protein